MVSKSNDNDSDPISHHSVDEKVQNLTVSFEIIVSCNSKF